MPLTQSPALVDSHCHLDFRDFNPDRMAVLDAARQAGVTAIVNPAVDVASSQEIVKWVQTVPEVYAAIGVHPNEATSWDDQALIKLEALADHQKVVAIGEIGLDYYRDRTPRSEQREVLEMQLNLAVRHNLPVILHNRDASQDLIAILSSWQAGLKAQGLPLAVRPGVLHSFSSDETIAQKAMGLNFFIGISGPVTYRNSTGLQHLVSKLPLERMLIETDAPFLTPQSYRGKRNEPAFVRYVAEKISELQNRSLQDVAYITTTNARLLFQIGEKTLV
jgi:TatD DNase family protein